VSHQIQNSTRTVLSGPDLMQFPTVNLSAVLLLINVEGDPVGSPVSLPLQVSYIGYIRYSTYEQKEWDKVVGYGV